MARKNTATKHVEPTTVAADEVAELTQEILDAPAIRPDVHEPRVLPDLTVTVETEAPVKVESVDAIKMSMPDLEKVGVKNKSDAIRYLASLGHKRSPIAKFLGIRYQHVNNVLGKELKRKAVAWEQKPAEQVEPDSEDAEQGA